MADSIARPSALSLTCWVKPQPLPGQAWKRVHLSLPAPSLPCLARSGNSVSKGVFSWGEDVLGPSGGAEELGELPLHLP
jgi:hypothetical protein